MENFIRHESLVNQIVQGLEKQILDGTLKPGERIIEENLCRSLGVSRSPIREAFRILESEGFVTHEPRKGISVAEVTPEEAANIYLIRANLESLAISLAVKRQDVTVLKELKELHHQMKKAASQNDVKTYFDLNLNFHELLIQACENKRLIQLIKSFEKQNLRYRLEVLSVPNWMSSSVKIHEELIRSFESGDAEKAEQIRKKGILSHVDRFKKDGKEGKSENRS
jgi:DNA-binding GntR family transcriptional regulator